jgi:DNA uptake protein ComE-like DNA-binding protein
VKGLKLTVLLALSVSILFAQETRREPLQQSAIDRRSASRYIFSPTSDALLMAVKIWGEVKNPGIYEVPIGIDLVELISSAGGPTSAAKLSSVKVIRLSENPEKSEVISVDVNEFLDTGNYEMIPEIKANDTIVVPKKITQTILGTTSQVLSVIYLLSMIDFYINR